MITLRLALVGVLALLAGCASSSLGKASSGGAVYEYIRDNPDGSSCSLRITSARNVTGGDIEIGPNCELKSRADDAGGAMEALEAIRDTAAKVLN